MNDRTEHPRDSDGAPPASVDWQAWHAGYDDPDSALRQRLALVQAQLRSALDRAPGGPLTLISVCAGQGHDAIGVLGSHPRRPDVRALLVELDTDNVRIAQRAAEVLGLDRVRAIAADASLSDSYASAVPADLVLVCGVLGNVASTEAAATIERIRCLCAPDATVIWTRHRHAPDLVPHIRESFRDSDFEELAFDEAPPYGVGAHRLVAAPPAFVPGLRLFEFVGHDALWPHLDEQRRAGLSALFRPDCSLTELVEAMRALPHGAPSEPTAKRMFSEARGTSATKHLFLAQMFAQRFPETGPEIVHRVYTLDRQRALDLFGEQPAAAVPASGLVDVHTYLTATLDGERVALDVTLSGPPWDGRSALEPACGPGQDFAADAADPDADERALVARYCDERLRAPFIAALTTAEPL